MYRGLGRGEIKVGRGERGGGGAERGGGIGGISNYCLVIAV